MTEWQSPKSAEDTLARRPTKAVAVLIVLAFAGLFVSLLPILDFPFMQVEATVHPIVRVEGRLVKVTGTTNLPDGAVIDYYFWHDRESVNDLGDIPGGDATVHSGTFEFEAELVSWPSGTARVITSFSVVWGAEQPATVVALLGAEGERLAGPQVYIDSPGDPKQILVSTPFYLPACNG